MLARTNTENFTHFPVYIQSLNYNNAGKMAGLNLTLETPLTNIHKQSREQNRSRKNSFYETSGKTHYIYIYTLST